LEKKLSSGKNDFEKKGTMTSQEHQPFTSHDSSKRLISLLDE
jgi:hypothetical protein